MSRQIGALWVREANGKKFWSGVLKDLGGDINIVVFPNEKKEKENQPDLNIILSEERKENKEQQQGISDPMGLAAVESLNNNREGEIKIENIPF